MPNLGINKEKLQSFGYTIQREDSYCAILSLTGEKVLEVLKLPHTVMVLNQESFANNRAVTLTIEKGIAVAKDSLGKVIVWASETK